ncbi:hypothetical protein SAPIO_CDS9601 [Scedosporium apiospermum]|uniref:Prokaryotic-type class I peptide chain release factors domain-containing protein n=1 Tax=Pseudallescheria apiosperma TaxID=563466 RepID=A0A084FX50_PSEDA|nr:uncharacterized protein SAPIO_CDS9601 [Scedosporium apiospermum]KEZ39662.1 hypothetical protein SAPIO_CDS9601 [Scedosporium apiospermum]
MPLARPFITLRATLPRRLFTTTPQLSKILPPRPKPPPDSEIEEVFIKGSGPGGQKINKTNSAVQLKHLPTGIVVKSQATRSRSQNRAIARNILAQRLDELYNGEQSRSAIVGDVKQKKRASASKKSRRKYRKLEEEKRAALGLQEDDGDRESEEIRRTDELNGEPSGEKGNDDVEKPQELNESASHLEENTPAATEKGKTSSSNPNDL